MSDKWAFAMARKSSSKDRPLDDLRLLIDLVCIESNEFFEDKVSPFCIAYS